MKLRTAQSGDADDICGVWNPVIRDSTITFTSVEKTPKLIEAMVAERGDAFIVALQGAKLVGFATYGPFRHGPGYAEVVEHSIYLDPSAHRKGIGQALMAQLCDVARKKGKRAMIACMTGDNTSAEAFHAKLGFDQVGLLPLVGRKLGATHDLRLMQKNL